MLPIASFFFVWQVPHFWLLILKYGKEYEEAGFPSLSGTMTEVQIARLIFLWISGTALIAVVFSFSGTLGSLVSKAGLWIASAWLILSFIPILRKSLSTFKPGKYFMRINYFVLLVIIFMCLDKIILRNIMPLL